MFPSLDCFCLSWCFLRDGGTGLSFIGSRYFSVSDVYYFSFLSLSIVSYLFISYFLFLKFLFHFSLYINISIHNYILGYVHARPASLGIMQQIMTNSYCFYGSLDTPTIVCLTATKFQAFMSSLLGFSFVCV